MDASVALEEMTFAHRDEFNRRTIAENLIKLLDTDMDFCPLLIDGGWGAGKTEFCHKLINLIKERDAALRNDAGPAAPQPEEARQQPEEKEREAENAKEKEEKDAAGPEKAPRPERAVIYLDAFAAEATGDPLSSLLNAIRAEFPEETRKVLNRMDSEEKALGWLEARDAVARFLERDTGEKCEMPAAIPGGPAVPLDEAGSALTDVNAGARRVRVALKEELAQATAKRPVLFFIDELDRCRPEFVFGMLELVKHVFALPGVKFILAANLDQLRADVRQRYGQNANADVYLEKFIKLSIFIPPVDNKTNLNASYILLRDAFPGIGIFDKEDSVHSLFIMHFIKKYNINLRGVNQYIQNIKIYMAVNNEKLPLASNIIPACNMAFLLAIFIFTFDKNMAKKFLFDDIDKEIFNFIGISRVEKCEYILAAFANLIYFGNHFSIEKINCTAEQRGYIQNVLKFIFGGFFDINDFNLRKMIANDIEVMNLLL